MGKASRWLRNLFLPGWKGRKAKDRVAADADCQSVLLAPLPSHSQAATAAPSGREKRRWSFRRPGASSGGAQGQGPLASSSSQCFSEAEVHVVVAQEQDKDQQQQFVAAAAVVVVPESASSAAGTVVPLPASGRRSAGGRDAEAAAAAVRIQAAFRSYLARKALCALRGMVKLQAMVRGQLVRRQANLTLRRMQALVHAQRRARAERLRLLEADDGASSRHQATATPRPPLSRRSPQHLRSRKPPEATEKSSEENDVRIVEVDDGAPRPGARRNSSCCHYSTSTTTPSRTPAKAELLLCQTKVSPSQTPSSARTDASARTLSGRFDVDDASFASASEPTPTPVPSRRRAWRADLPAFPSYMANTESSRAKARSQSAPRQRLSSASETTALAASPSPSCWERPPSRGGGGGSARRRALLDPLDLPGGGGGAPSRRMERCASRARASTMSSVTGSECGSSSTVGLRCSARTGHSHGIGMGPLVTTDSSRSQCTLASWRGE